MNLTSDEYKKSYDRFDYSQIDLSVIQKHIDAIEPFIEISHLAISIYDTIVNKPVYMSEYYQAYFENDWESVHPDDIEPYMRSSVIAIRYFFNTKEKVSDYRLLRKYRVKVKEKYLIVDEELIPLETDINDKVWLALIIMNISTSQPQQYKFDFKILNYKTAELISPADDCFDGKPILSNREIEILRLIEQGYLSKEISDRLSISINTVSKHRQHILEKLKVNSSIEAIKYASALGIL